MWRHLTGWEITDVSKDNCDFKFKGRNVCVIRSDATSLKNEYLKCTSANTKKQWTQTDICTHDLDRGITDCIVLTITITEKVAVRLLVGMTAYAIHCYVILRSSIFSDFYKGSVLARSRILANAREHGLVKQNFVSLLKRLFWKQTIRSNRAKILKFKHWCVKNLFIFFLLIMNCRYVSSFIR
jgi:hypothetical protein